MEMPDKDGSPTDQPEIERRSLLKTIGAGSLALFGAGTASDPVRATAQLDTELGSRVNYTDGVIYQILTDRFRDGDSSNNPDDGAIYDGNCDDLTKYCGGDWQGIIDKIEDGYLPELGVSALWISPPFDNTDAAHPDDEQQAAYHGYWPRDLKRPNPYFGDVEDFQRLIDVAHDNGIKIVLDLVHNHTNPASAEDPSKMEDGALYDDGNYVASYNDDPDGRFRRNGGTNFEGGADSIYRNLFDLPDIDQQNPAIDQYLRESVRLWLDMGVDGIRIDANRHVSKGWQKSLMDEVYDYQPVFTFGEWFLGPDEVDQEYYDFSNETGMSMLDFRFSQELRQVLRDGTDDWQDFVAMLEDTASSHDQVLDQVTFLDNHDKARWRETEDDDPFRSDMGLAVLLTSRGVPTVYYGTEQYMTGDGDPGSRQFMSGFDRNTNAFNIISTLASLRQENPALAYGDTQERWVNQDVLFYEREFGDNVVLVCVNRSETEWYEITGLETSLPGGTYDDVLAGRVDGYSLDVNADGSVDAFWLGPETVSVWEYAGTTSTPTLGHVGPTMGQVGHTITISGEGFGDTSGSVLFGTTEAEIVSWSDTEVQADVPWIAGGHYDVTVVDANGTESNAYERFDVLSDEQVSVRFVVQDAETVPGEAVYLVGNVHELGEWDPDAAVGPFYNDVVYEYPDWFLDVSVPAGRDLEFKFVTIDENGNVTWESGSNRQLTTPTDTTDEYVGTWKE